MSRRTSLRSGACCPDSGGAGARPRLGLGLLLLLAACARPGLDQPAPLVPPPAAEAPPQPTGTSAELLATLLAELPRERALGTPGHRATREWLLQRLRDWGLQPVVRPVAWKAWRKAELANLEVRLGPQDSPASFVVCAHYDAVRGSPGADDNGSGVVTLMALARSLASHPLSAEVRLLFLDAEEVGLVGSVSYLKGLSEQQRTRIAGVINLEAVGYAARHAGSQRMPPGVRAFFDPGDRGDFLLVVGNVASSDLARSVGAALQRQAGLGDAMRVEVFSWVPGAGFLLPDTRRSDHAPFWDAGIPALMLTDTANFRNPHYHRPTDVPETLDLPFLLAVARGVELAVLELAGE